MSDHVGAAILALDHPSARQQTFNICIGEPVDYQQVAEYLGATRGLPSVAIRTAYWSTWLDTPRQIPSGPESSHDLKRLIDEAWSYERSESDPRKLWYPG